MGETQYEICIRETGEFGHYEWELYRVTTCKAKKEYTLKVLTNSGCSKTLEKALKDAELCIP